MPGMNLSHIVLAVPTGIPSFSVSLDEYCSGIKNLWGCFLPQHSHFMNKYTSTRHKQNS